MHVPIATAWLPSPAVSPCRRAPYLVRALLQATAELTATPATDGSPHAAVPLLDSGSVPALLILLLTHQGRVLQQQRPASPSGLPRALTTIRRVSALAARTLQLLLQQLASLDDGSRPNLGRLSSFAPQLCACCVVRSASFESACSYNHCYRTRRAHPVLVGAPNDGMCHSFPNPRTCLLEPPPQEPPAAPTRISPIVPHVPQALSASVRGTLLRCGLLRSQPGSTCAASEFAPVLVFASELVQLQVRAHAVGITRSDPRRR